MFDRKKFLIYSAIAFFLFFSDAVLSFWAPNLMEEKLGGSFLMGLVFSFSSVVGFLSDLVLPQIIKNLTVSKMLTIACMLSVGYALLLILGLSAPYIFVFMLAMAVWGIYYEFISFADQEFISGHTPTHAHSSAWGILGVFRSLAYFLGPLIAPLIIVKSESLVGLFSIVIATIAFVGILIFEKSKKIKTEVEVERIDIFSEIAKWKVLFSHVWPVIILSIVIGLVDSFFWTLGAVLTENLSKTSFWGGWFLSLYVLPSVFLGLVVAKWGIYKGKKKMAEMLFLMAGIILFALGFGKNIFVLLFLVLLASSFMAVAYPLVQAVISDVLGRMGKSKRHLIGFASSSISIGYVVGPITAGFISSKVGELQSFSYLGAFVVLVSILLLATTPKKLKLPQEEIKSW